jgi:hypothetical protein
MVEGLAAGFFTRLIAMVACTFSTLPFKCDVTGGPAAAGQNPALIYFTLANTAGMFHFHLAGDFPGFAGAASATATGRRKPHPGRRRGLQNGLAALAGK